MEKEKPLILVSNDDGVMAKGINELVNQIAVNSFRVDLDCDIYEAVVVRDVVGRHSIKDAALMKSGNSVIWKRSKIIIRNMSSAET